MTTGEGGILVSGEELMGACREQWLIDRGKTEPRAAG